jgi:hypothetical protein
MHFILPNVSGVQVRALFMKRHAQYLQEQIEIRSARDQAAPALGVQRDVIPPELNRRQSFEPGHGQSSLPNLRESLTTVMPSRCRMDLAGTRFCISLQHVPHLPANCSAIERAWALISRSTLKHRQRLRIDYKCW